MVRKEVRKNKKWREGMEMVHSAMVEGEKGKNTGTRRNLRWDHRDIKGKETTKKDNHRGRRGDGE